MRVRAGARELTPEQREAMGGLAKASRARPPRGEEHVVLGLVFAWKHPRLGNGAWIIYQDDLGNPLTEPLALYDVIDKRLSRQWELCKVEQDSLALWPPIFGQPHFLEDAVERKSPERARLDAIRASIEAEADKPGFSQ